MKKLVIAILAISLALGSASGALAQTDANTLVLGLPAMNGDWIHGFGNSSYDNFVKVMLHDYMDTVTYTPAGEYLVNPTVVEDYTVETDEAGNKTYTWKLHEDLLWSDGSQITAQDYVFWLMYFSSPAWVEAGASNGSAGYGLVGYEAWNSGDADVFAGVKLIDEFTFSMTIDAKELPYFYEITYSGASPAPKAVYAPNCEIVSDENGAKVVAKDFVYEPPSDELIAAMAYFGYDTDPANLEAAAVATANKAALLAALQKVAETERFAPTISSGPYKFVSFENQSVFLEINEFFKGNYEGKKPSIQFIEQRFVPQDMDVDMLIAGEIDATTGEVQGDKIEKAKAAENVHAHSYLRAGYGHFSMHCDFGPTMDANVRWAMGYLIDRNAVVDYVLGGYGGITQAEYGFAQWMYEEAGAELEELLTPFNLNIDKANEHLDMTEWLFEADGVTPFDASKADAEGTYLRHNAAGEVLALNHLGTVDNPITDIIEIQYMANAPLAGLKFSVTRGDFNALLDNFYYGYDLGEDRQYHTFNLAVNFTPAFDPYFSSWHSDFIGSWENSNQLSDPQLDELIMAMRSLDPTQKDEFVEIWLQYQVRWQQLLPQVPLYSNEYFDLISTRVSGFNTTPFATYARIICDITKDAE
ncbi:MAG: ABC transporter substrate-binding protein [Clostridia bacterium]|nr:ABC transporter substrate-binding protein [Clostridia bacterium]